jgi:hypothetical protein
MLLPVQEKQNYIMELIGLKTQIYLQQDNGLVAQQATNAAALAFGGDAPPGSPSIQEQQKNSQVAGTGVTRTFTDS